MNTWFVIVLCSCILALAASLLCSDSSMCQEEECCSGIPFFGGFCRTKTKLSGKCHIVDKDFPMYGYFVVGATCPCAEGLVCVLQGKKKNDGKCQLPPTPAPELPVSSAAPELPSSSLAPKVPVSSAAPEVPVSSAAPEVPVRSSEAEVQVGTTALEVPVPNDPQPENDSSEGPAEVSSETDDNVSSKPVVPEELKSSEESSSDETPKENTTRVSLAPKPVVSSDEPASAKEIKSAALSGKDASSESDSSSSEVASKEESISSESSASDAVAKSSESTDVSERNGPKKRTICLRGRVRNP